MTEKPLIWSDHALTASGERVLRDEWIAATIRGPDWTHADPKHPDRERRYKAIPAYDNRIMRVVVVETSDEIRIVTAFFDRKARRP